MNTVHLQALIARFPLRCTAIAHRGGGDRKLRCGRVLRLRDELTVVCDSNDGCGAEYRVENGVPYLVAHDDAVPPPTYDDDLLAQAYVEMHFGSFVLGEAGQPEQQGALDSGDVAALARRILDMPDATGSFYSAVADLILEHATSADGLVADIACGMARMGHELQARGWTGDYLGVDLSPRLVHEAARVWRDGATTVRVPAPPGALPRSVLAPIEAPRLAPDRSLLAVGNADRLALMPESCDVVLALNLVDRVPDPVATVLSLWSHVKVGGILVLADPFHWEGLTAAERRIYSFDPVAKWLPDAQLVGERSIVFPVRRRDSRRIVLYDDLVNLFRRTRSSLPKISATWNFATAGLDRTELGRDIQRIFKAGFQSEEIWDPVGVSRAIDGASFVGLLEVEGEVEPQGYAIYSLIDASGGKLLWETSVAIVAREDLRDRGLSSAALHAALKLARCGPGVTFVGGRTQNVKVMHRYRSLGAKKVWPFDSTYVDEDGTRVLNAVAATVGAAWTTRPEPVAGICRRAYREGYLGVHPTNDPAASEDSRTDYYEQQLRSWQFDPAAGDAVVVVAQL